MKYLSPFLAVALLAAVSSADESKPHIVLVGDSTVTDNAGWGLGFRQFLADGVELTNTSQGGRSSMSFIQEGRWEKALALKADYYLIQFGHNDQPGKPGRSTTPEEFRETMARYVDEARAAGAKPVLVTPLVRREFRDKDGPNRIVSSLQPWAEAVRKIAGEKEVPLVELHERSKELCESMGRDGVAKISPVKPNGDFDGTHLNSAGYVPVGRIVAQELKNAVPALAPFILGEPRDASPQSAAKDFEAVVAFDGSGTHTTVQAAIDAAPADTTAERQFRILVKPGIYQEHVAIPAGKRFIRLMGEFGEEKATIITMANNVNTPDPEQTGKKLSTPDSATVLIDASDIACSNITFENTTTREQKVQALACFIRGDRVSFLNCRFLGWQDTLRPDSSAGKICRQYFRECYIEGHVDYIYAGGTAVFDRCQIHSKADGYITAASTAETTPYGFVFLDCKVTTGPGVERGVFLGRPWRPFAQSAFIRCEMDGKIHPEGWHNWGNPENEKTARYSEYKSSGPGARPTARAHWSKQLSDAEAAAYTVENILRGDDGWKPAR